MKLRTKIHLFSSLFMLLVILLINTSIYYLFYNISADSELDQLVASTDTIVETLNSNPGITETNLLRAYVPTDGMIRVIEKDSHPIIEQTKKYKYTTLESEYTTSEIRTVLTTDNKEKVALVAKPIIWKENGEIVTLQVSKHLTSLKTTMTTLFYVLTVASFIMLIPTIIAGSLLSRFLLRPIQSLIHTMKENTEHEQWKKISSPNRSKDEIYEMERTFNEMIDHLEENFRKQEEFVSDASHELKTPISIIKGYAQFLERRGSTTTPELLTESVEAISSEADRMQKLVEQMLLLAKNKVEMAMDNISLTALCEEAVKTFAGAYSREITFHKDKAAIFVKGNESQLQQIIYILVNNALKYSEDKIELTLNRRNSLAILQVKDYGVGISEVEQERIFDRFYRIDKARSRESGGTGLGLSIAKTIAKQHHGKISVRSKLGKGTVFTLELPIVKEQ